MSSPTAESAACAPRYAGTIDANCLSDGKDRAWSATVLEQRMRRVHRRAARQNGEGREQEAPEGVEGEGQVQQ